MKRQIWLVLGVLCLSCEDLSFTEEDFETEETAEQDTSPFFDEDVPLIDTDSETDEVCFVSENDTPVHIKNQKDADKYSEYDCIDASLVLVWMLYPETSIELKGVKRIYGTLEILSQTKGEIRIPDLIETNDLTVTVLTDNTDMKLELAALQIIEDTFILRSPFSSFNWLPNIQEIRGYAQIKDNPNLFQCKVCDFLNSLDVMDMSHVIAHQNKDDSCNTNCR